jgi:uncharacterized membrane protein YkoI
MVSYGNITRKEMIYVYIKIIFATLFCIISNIGLVSAAKLTPKISVEQAKQIAVNHVTGKILDVELEKENGVLVYEVDITSPNQVYEVTIDANTGKVLEIEKEGKRLKKK